MVLLPPFFLPNKTESCNSDSVGMANLTKHCLMISSKESKQLSSRLAMSVKACWSRPIAVLDGKERQALRISTARKTRLLAHTHAPLRHVFHAMLVYCPLLSLKPTASSFPHSRFHSWAYSSATHCGSAVKFPCLSLMTSGSSGSASSFPHHPWAGPAPLFNAWHSYLCVARLLHASPF